MPKSEIRKLSTSGVAWDALKIAADTEVTAPNLSNEKDLAHANVLAKALVFARTGDESRSARRLALAQARDRPEVPAPK